MAASIAPAQIKAGIKAESVLIIAITVLMLDVMIGQAVAEWREQGTNPFWAFGKSYFWTLFWFMAISFGVMLAAALPLVATIGVFGRYLGTVIGAAIAMWLWAGAYNRFRDVVIAAVIALLVFLFSNRFVQRMRSWATTLIASLEARVARLNDSPREKDSNSGKTAVTESLISILRALESGRSVRYAGALWLVLTWTVTSFADVTFGPTWWSAAAPAPIGATRFAQLEQQRAAASASTQSPATESTPRRVGVALSGGGFRAAVMHAGVLAALDELHVPISGMATVSGGSIIGGYYVLGGAPADFKRAVADGRFNLKRDIADIQNFLLLPCPGHLGFVNVDLLWFCPDHSRIDAQANLLDRVLYDGKRLQELTTAQRQTARAPFWLIGATDLLTGENIGISAQGILRRAQANPVTGPHQDQLLRSPSAPRFEDASGQQSFIERRIAELVAYSGAFPGAFASTTFAATKDSQLQIVDGGITDNLGYSLLVSAKEVQAKPAGTDWSVDRIIVSDGGMPLSQRTNVPRFLGAGDLMRAMDVVYASAGIGVGKSGAEAIWLFPGSIQLDQIREVDFDRLPKTLRDSRKLTQLQDFRNDLDLTRKTFLATSTLKDNFTRSYAEATWDYFYGDSALAGRDAVEALFTLGEYLVYLNVCAIQSSVGTPAAGRVPGC